MSLDTVTAQYESLERVAVTFERAHERIKGSIKGIGERVRILQNGGWEGRGASAFYSEMDSKVMPAFQRLASALHQSARTTRHIAKVLHEAEQEAAQLFKAVPLNHPSDYAKPSLANTIPASEQYVSLLTDMPMQEGGTETPTPPITPTLRAQPTTPPSFTLPNIVQDEMILLFAQFEEDVPSNILDKYVRDPNMMAHQNYLVEQIAQNAANGGAPLTLDQIYQIALSSTGDPLTALLVTHNVMKAMTRGSDIILWERVTDIRPDNPATPMPNSPEYTDGSITYWLDSNGDTIQDTNELYTLNVSGQSTDGLGYETGFFAMVDSSQLGTDDPGDYYHYFLNAAATYSMASGTVPYTPAYGGPTIDQGLGTIQAIDGIMDDWGGGTGASSPGYQGWVFANALSFAEGANYGGDGNGSTAELQAAALRESNVHREGALFGLQLAGITPDPSWNWYVPDVDTYDYFAGGRDEWYPNITDDLYSTLDPNGNPR